jgi:hypothetical protein
MVNRFHKWFPSFAPRLLQPIDAMQPPLYPRSEGRLPCERPVTLIGSVSDRLDHETWH